MQELLLTQKQELRPLPIQIQAITVLAMNSLDLQRFIDAEASENPALSINESARCPACGFLSSCSICPVCGSPRQRAGIRPRITSKDERQWIRQILPPPEERSHDPFQTVADSFDLRDYLKSQANMAFSGRDLRIAEFIIESLDDDGYFRESLYETSERFSVAVPEVEAVLSVIHTFDPPGIAARDLQECLLIQLKTLERSDEISLIVKRILEEHWEDFSRLRFKHIASKLNISVEVVKKAREFIRLNLNPYPASAYHCPFRHTQPRETSVVVPDVMVVSNGWQIDVHVLDWVDQLIGIDESYKRASEMMKTNSQQFREDERQHIKEQLTRARNILEAIELRKNTLARVARAVVEHQKDFILKGCQYLKPLHQKKIAQELGLHESTVSRALANKYCRLPSNETVSFEVFFDSALPVREMISRIISISPKPLSDSEIARQLAEQGVVVARRTVAKYRAQLRELPYHLRNI
ncbi:MAG: RNA polymerase factor sigma-54 [Armatimonadota bacterium]